MTASDRVSRHRGSDHLLVAALARGETQDAAARIAGLSERTVRRRLADASFVADLSEARADVRRQVTGRMGIATQTALDTLLALLGEGISPSVRLGASKAILELDLRYTEVVELDQRLANLEGATRSAASV